MLDIKIKEATISILDTGISMPVISTEVLELTPEIEEYIEVQVERLHGSDDSKKCTLDQGLSQFQSDGINNQEMYNNIASKFFRIMEQNIDIPIGDLIMGKAIIGEDAAFFFLKMEYKEGLTHMISHSVQGKIELVPYKTILPSKSAKATEGFIVFPNTNEALVVEKPYLFDDTKDVYISSRILQTTTEKSAKETISEIMKTVKTVNKSMPIGRELGVEKVNTVLHNTMKDDLSLDIEKVSEAFYPEDVRAKTEFVEILKDKEIDQELVIPVSEKTVKKFEKKLVKTYGGVEIKIPAHVYANTDEVEFINNPNGTVSVLIKNVKAKN